MVTKTEEVTLTNNASKFEVLLYQFIKLYDRLNLEHSLTTERELKLIKNLEDFKEITLALNNTTSSINSTINELTQIELKLSAAIQSCVADVTYDLWDYEECITNWCQQVGGAQLILPAHIINEYSHTSRSFYLCPKWQGEGEPVLPRIGVADWINNNGYKLGSDFAWIRTDLNRRAKIGKNNFSNKYNKWRVTDASPWWDESRNEAYVWTFQQEDGAVPRDLAACIELLTSRTEQARLLLDSVGLKATAASFVSSAPKPSRQLVYNFHN